jgi:hypothetical protein
MSNLQNQVPLSGPRTVLDKIKGYSRKAGELGHRIRDLVFGFRSRSTGPIDRWSLPVKLLQRHRILQRRRVFEQSGGNRSSIAKYAMKKARHGRQSS